MRAVAAFLLVHNDKALVPIDIVKSRPFGYTSIGLDYLAKEGLSVSPFEVGIAVRRGHCLQWLCSGYEG